MIGYLVVRSEFAPRWLGIWLVLGGLGWCVAMIPVLPYTLRLVAMVLGGLSEVALFLWLLVRAVRR